MTIKLCEFNNDEIFNMTLTSDADINADLIIVITLNYKLNFKFIKLSFKLNLKINRVLSYSLNS